MAEGWTEGKRKRGKGGKERWVEVGGDLGERASLKLSRSNAKYSFFWREIM